VAKVVFYLQKSASGSSAGAIALSGKRACGALVFLENLRQNSTRIRVGRLLEDDQSCL